MQEGLAGSQQSTLDHTTDVDQQPWVDLVDPSVSIARGEKRSVAVGFARRATVAGKVSGGCQANSLC